MRIRNRAWKCSVWIDSSNVIHEFFVGDTTHAQSKCIDAKLEDIAQKCHSEGTFQVCIGFHGIFPMLQRKVFSAIILRSWPLHVPSSIQLKEKLFISQRTTNIKAMRFRNRAWKKPGRSLWVDSSNIIHARIQSMHKENVSMQS